ncbi:MAG TPA: hypothetical protein VIV11_26360 [Kofleriaceae bacterium]
MRIAAVVVFGLVTACGARQPSSPPAPTSACAAGMELYGVDVDPVDDSDEAREQLRIYTSGAWTYEANGATERGCLEQRDVARVERALDRATWMQTVTAAPCTHAAAPPTTIYYVNGAQVHEAHGCSAILDDPTRNALAEIDAIVDAVRAR